MNGAGGRREEEGPGCAAPGEVEGGEDRGCGLGFESQPRRHCSRAPNRGGERRRARLAVYVCGVRGRGRGEARSVFQSGTGPRARSRRAPFCRSPARRGEARPAGERGGRGRAARGGAALPGGGGEQCRGEPGAGWSRQGALPVGRAGSYPAAGLGEPERRKS